MQLPNQRLYSLAEPPERSGRAAHKQPPHTYLGIISITHRRRSVFTGMLDLDRRPRLPSTRGHFSELRLRQYVARMTKSHRFICSDAKLEESEVRREALRAELHSYGALHAEPDLEGCCGQVEAVAHNPQLEEFLRKAGGLKNELLVLAQVQYVAHKWRNRGGVEPNLMCETLLA